MKKPKKTKNPSAALSQGIGTESAATGFIRAAQLRVLVPVSPATLWRWVKLKQFPAPTKIGNGRVTAWRVEDVHAWLDQQTNPSPQS